MSQETPHPCRFVGLDVHKHYLVAYAVDAERQRAFGPQRVPLAEFEAWRQKWLTREDAVVLEMTTNSFQLHDDLVPHVHSVTVVHPPHVALITRARVMTDKIAARVLAQLHAKGMLVGIWVPPQPVRERRALLAQRSKMVRLSTQAKNRLHAVLHRHHLGLPQGSPFAETARQWWLDLPVDPLERMRIQTDLDTLAFAQRQIAGLEECLATAAAQDGRVPFLVQTTGISLLTALTLLAAIGDIHRFPSDRQVVGYAGLGTSIHDSGQTARSGRITKAGRRDLRAAMVEAAHTAANCHPHWQAELKRLEPRLGRNKAIVAIARKLLVVVWHTLTEETADHHADAERVARKLLQHAYKLGQTNRQPGQTTAQGACPEPQRRVCASNWIASVSARSSRASSGASASSRSRLRRWVRASSSFRGLARTERQLPPERLTRGLSWKKGIRATEGRRPAGAARGCCHAPTHGLTRLPPHSREARLTSRHICEQ